jgi:hypothetical protein
VSTKKERYHTVVLFAFGCVFLPLPYPSPAGTFQRKRTYWLERGVREGGGFAPSQKHLPPFQTVPSITCDYSFV